MIWVCHLDMAPEPEPSIARSAGPHRQLPTTDPLHLEHLATPALIDQDLSPSNPAQVTAADSSTGPDTYRDHCRLCST